MNNLPLVSVIVPAYNAEKWIIDCYYSVLEQSYENWELIIVDDGSTDNTYKVCTRIMQNCKKVKILHTENGGVSKARNLGLEKAKGDYILFLDADDMLVPNAIQLLYDATEEKKYDIVVGWKNNMDEQGNSFGCPYEREEAIWRGQDALKMSLKDHPATYAAWGKLYKKEFLKPIRFVEGKRVHEDSFFVFQCCCQEPYVKIIKDIVLNYRITANSASRTQFSEKFLDILHFANEKRIIIKKDFPELAKNVENTYLKANMALLRILCLNQNSKYKKIEKECLKEIRRNRKYFVAATKDNKKWFWIITHHFYYPYKLMKNILRKK